MTQASDRRRSLLCLLLGGLGLGCADQIGGAVAPWDGSALSVNGGQLDEAGQPFKNPDASGVHIPDAFFSDARPTVDAFFINDPPPLVCGPDGGMMTAQNPGGTPDCPGDKNREGCPCAKVGETAACWPGKRINRNHGVCKDGMTTCNASDEFGQRWGPCEGFVLPTDGALAGPEACGCFSSGTWAADNLVPCIFTSNGASYLYSSKLESGKPVCETRDTNPPQAPTSSWARTRLNVECSGQFELCFQIKAGDNSAPLDTDCVLTRQCFDVWYDTPGQFMDLPDLQGWVSKNTNCAKKFIDSGGYGEMTVQGRSAECDVVDDGMGQPFVFYRTNYCPVSCNSTPNAPGCKNCQTGGAGMF